MEIIQILCNEHRIITRVLGCLEKATDYLENGQNIRPKFFIEIANFNKGLIENHHQTIEETILFEAMFKCGLSRNDRSLTIASLEHEQSILYGRRLHTGAERWLSGNITARREVIRNAWGYIALLQQHMQDEENKIFVRAKKIITSEAQRDLTSSYKEFIQKSEEQGIFEKFTGMVSTFELEFS